MGFMKGALLFSAGCLLSFQAMADVAPHHEYRRRIEAAQQVSVLRDGFLGDRTSLFDGKTEFSVVDVSLPGNNALPVSFGRRFSIELDLQGTTTWKGRYGGLANWDVDVPHLVGTFPSVDRWLANRCTASFAPSVPDGFDQHEVWQGLTVHVPGEGDRAVLVPRVSGGSAGLTPLPGDGRAYRYVTRQRDAFDCIPMKAGLPGEGFRMRTTDGLVYSFDVAAVRNAGYMRRNIGVNFNVGKLTSLNRIYLMASRVEDRHGNFVDYSYDASGNLTAISSNDGRAIHVAYVAGQVASVTAAGRAWSYGYAAIDGKLVLGAVTLPDATKWKYEHSNALSLSPNASSWDASQNERCSIFPPADSWQFNFKVTHPGGATGSFEFSNKRHYRSGVHVSHCMTRIVVSTEGRNRVHQLTVPNFFDVVSLNRKTIAGPGLAQPMQWQYHYGGGKQGLWGSPGTAAVYPCTTCIKEKVVTRTDPDGAQHRFRIGILYAENEGRELGVDVFSPSGALMESREKEYLADGMAEAQAFDPLYGYIMNGDEPSSARVRPVVRSWIRRDGVEFERSVAKCNQAGRYCFDDLGYATQEIAKSGLSSPRKEDTEYRHDRIKWLLGMPSKRTVNGIVSSETAYDVNGRPAQLKSFGKLVQALTYNANGTVATIKDANNKVTTLFLWKRGIPGAIRYPATPEAPAGAIQSADIDNNGWIRSVTDENGFTTSYTYDPMGRLASIVYPTGDTPASLPTTLVFQPVAATEYGIPAGHWRQTVSTGNARKVTYFDALWRPLVTREYDTANEAATRRFQRFAYDHEGRVTFASYPGTTDALTTGATTTYDALGRVTQVSQSSELGALVTSTAYEAGFKTRVTDPKGHATTTSYLAYDQPGYDWPTAVTDSQGVTEVDRDVFGKPRRITRRNAAGTIKIDRHYVYDALNQRLCKTIEPETGTELYAYDEVGNLVWSASGQALPSVTSCDRTLVAENQKVLRVYDGRNRLTTLSFPDGRGDQDWLYTKDNLPSQVTTHNGGGNTVINSYTYNNRRLLTGEAQHQTGGQPWSIGYGYTGNGHLASLVYPAGLTVDYAPNALGQPTRAGTYATGVSYYPNGAIKQFSYGNGVIHTMTQNARQLPSRTTSNGGVLDLGYTYDKNANVTNLTDYTTGARQTRGMTYDAMNRLTQTTSSMFGTASYSYNVLDNLGTVKVTGGPQVRDHTYVYDARNRLTNVTNTVGGASVIGLGYDVRGNLANRSGQLYQFDFGNRLRSAPGGETYHYDAHGRRVAAHNGTPIFSVYSQSGQLLFQRDDRTSKRLQHVYLGGSQIATRERPVGGDVETITYQHTDALGSPIAVTNPAKVKVQSSEYEPYGKLLNRANDNRPGYTGHVMDTTGMTYMQQRYYDPQIGLFLSVDPVTAYGRPIAGFNRYRYAANNPYKFVDHDGRCEKTTGSRICGGGAGNSVSVMQVNPSGGGNRPPSRSEMQSRPVASSNSEDYDHSDPTFHKYDFGSSLCVEGPGCSVKDLAPTVAPDSAPRFGSVDQGYNVLHLNNPIIHTYFFAEDGSFYMINATTSAHNFHAGAVVSRLYSAGGFVNLHTSGFGYSSNFATKMANFAVGYAYFGAWQINLSGAAKISSGQMRPPK